MDGREGGRERLDDAVQTEKSRNDAEQSFWRVFRWEKSIFKSIMSWWDELISPSTHSFFPQMNLTAVKVVDVTTHSLLLLHISIIDSSWSVVLMSLSEYQKDDQ